MGTNPNVGIFNVSYSEHMDTEIASNIVKVNNISEQDAKSSFKSSFKANTCPTDVLTTDSNTPEGNKSNQEIKLFNLQQSNKYNQQNIYVYIEKTNSQNLGRLHPMIVGHILHNKLNLKNNITSIEKSGINRVRVGIKTLEQANKLISNPALANENLKAFIPNNLLYRKGIIKDVDTSFDEEYLKSNIESLCTVTSVNRFKRKVVDKEEVKFVPGHVVCLTFEGNVLPNYVKINSVIFSVEPHIQRVIQCFKCLRYGHVANQCRNSKTLCINCGQEKNDDHICNINYCINCKSNSHKTTSKMCPRYAEQQQIKKHMAEV